MDGSVATTGTRSKTVTWEDPVGAAQAGAGLSGIEYMSAIARGDIARPPVAGLLGMELIAVEPGHAVFELTPGEEHFNPIGVVHGGMIATLVDSAMGCAVHATLPAGDAYTTLEFKVNFLRPVTVQTGTLRAEGTVIHRGRRVATAEARVTDPDGRIVAHATTTCIVMEGEHR